MELISSISNKLELFRNLQKKVSPLLTRMQKKTSQVWQKVKSEQKSPIKETFVSHIQVADVKNIEGSKVDFDRIRREFDSHLLRKAMDNNESVFFEDDFVSSSDWANSAVKEQESFTSLITPIIKDFDSIEKSLTLEIQEELRRVNPKLNAAEKKAAPSILLQQQSHKDALINLQKEKEEKLENRLELLEQGFKGRERQISNFESLGEKTTDQFLKGIAHANAQFKDEKISKRAEKIVKKNKKFVDSVVKESSERLNQDFKIQSSKIHEEINAKFEEKEKAVHQNLKEGLQSIQENLLKEKQIISDLSAKQVKSLESEIESRREKLVNQLQNPRQQISDSQNFDISPETWEKLEAALEKSPVSKEKVEPQEETSEGLFQEFPSNWFHTFQENIKLLDQEESNTDSKESLDSTLPKRESEMTPISSFDSLQNLDNHPSVIEAKKLLSDLEKDYERRMTEVCRSGENRLQAFKKEKKQRILNIENSLQNNLKIAQEVAAKPREKAEQKLAKILQSKKSSNPIRRGHRKYKKSIAKHRLKREKDKEFRVIDAAFEKNHLLRNEGILNIKKETEDLERQVLQEIQAQRTKELARFRNLQNKVDNLVQTLQISPWLEEVSIL